MKEYNCLIMKADNEGAYDNIINCVVCPDKTEKYKCRKDKTNCLKAAINRLAELEDKMENGTLVELPCKVGDSVFIATKFWDIKEVVEAKVTRVEYFADEQRKDFIFHLDHKYVFSKTNPNLVVERYIFWKEEFFPTKAEAEAKLKELKGV